jgi:hypothetical protein
MQFLRRAEPLDCGDIVALVHHRKRKTGDDAAPADHHRARAALALIAALLAAREIEMFAQRIEQRGPRIELDFAPFAVHVERDFIVAPGPVNAGAEVAWARSSSCSNCNATMPPAHPPTRAMNSRRVGPISIGPGLSFCSASSFAGWSGTEFSSAFMGNSG